jgi:hypothetical protein
MKTVKDFVESMVRIDLLEDYNCYGHYPFQLLVEAEDGHLDINALALGGDVAACYRRVSKYLKEGVKKIFMSLDFPAGDDIEKDFICIFSIVEGKYEVYAIPYSVETGEKYEEIHSANVLDKILEDFKTIVNR